MALICTSTALVLANVIPTNEWVNYDGGASFNGYPAPLGSVIDAYDPQGVHCGTFTVGDVVSMPGIYGFMPVYRDDATTPGVDEGAQPGDAISFKLNGRDAMVANGSTIWTTNGDTNEVDLVVDGATILIKPAVYPSNDLGAPGDTVRFWVCVCNGGDGLDFYKVRAASDTSGNAAWISVDQDSISYADPNDTAKLYFDVILEPFAPGDTIYTINYSVMSCLDTNQRIDTTVMLIKSVTDVPENGDELPGSFALFQNYPNPFNPTTTISFSVFERSFVQFEVYNLLGQQIEARDLGILPAGDHQVEFTGQNQPSGVYFYRLITESGAQSRKMVLLK